MSLIANLAFTPILLFFTFPLALFAALTSIIAFSTLLIRALIVYADLAGVLVQNQLSIPFTNNSTRKSKPSKLVHNNKNNRRKSGSSNGGSLTPRAQELTGLGAYGSGSPTRDFEGVGGWRVPGSEDEDVLWTHMKSRLQLPNVDGQSNHHRSRTSTSLVALPLLTPSPTQSCARTPTRSYVGSPPSPEEYFSNPKSSKSTTSLDSASQAIFRDSNRPGGQ